LHHPRTILLRLSLGITLVTWLNAVPQHPVESVQRRGEIELLSLHKQERKAHFGHDVQALLAHIGTQLLDIRDGRVPAGTMCGTNLWNISSTLSFQLGMMLSRQSCEFLLMGRRAG
jgi:hypothetical protein